MNVAVLRDEDWTVIYKAFGAEWRQYGYSRPWRPLKPVVLGEGITGSITADIKEFICELKWLYSNWILDKSVWYSARGIPYQRGYLLHSPPGHNKNSFITALANWCCAFIFFISDPRSKFTWNAISVCLISMKWPCQLVGWTSMKIN